MDAKNADQIAQDTLKEAEDKMFEAQTALENANEQL